jgi:hypothetical protein
LVLACDQNLDDLEVQAARHIEKPLHQAVERDAQTKADASSSVYRDYDRKHTRLSHDHPPRFTGRFRPAAGRVGDPATAARIWRLVGRLYSRSTAAIGPLYQAEQHLAVVSQPENI